MSPRLIHRFATFSIVIAVFLVSCRQEKASPSLLTLGNRVVTLEEFQTEFDKSLPAGQNTADIATDDLKRSFLVQLIDRELILAEARRLGIAVSSEEAEAALQEYRRDYPGTAFDEALKERGMTKESLMAELRGGLLMEKVVRQAVYSSIQVADEEIENYYREHRRDFDRPQQVRARQIVVATEEEGQKVLGILRQGGDFAETARLHSLSPDAQEGGDLGFFARGEMPSEFEEAAFSLPVGRLSELVKSEYGYHIFLVEERKKAVRLSLDEARDEIQAILKGRKEEAAYQDWLQGLRARASIEVDWSLL